MNDIVMKGAYFSKRHGTPIVRFGDVEAAQVEFIDAGELRVKAPAQGAGEVLLSVVNYRKPRVVDGVEVPVLSEASNSLQFEYIATSAPAPTLSGVSPSSGSIDGGTIVTLTGGAFQVGASVSFGGVPATDVTFLGEQNLQVTAPARENDGVVDVELVNPDGQSGQLTGAFTYVTPPPVVSDVFPQEASTKGGTFVVVSGSGFRPGIVVEFVAADGASVPSANVNRASSSTLLVATPMVPAGGDYTVRVNNVGGESASFAGNFRYLAPTGPAPRLISVDPPVGFRESTNPITLRGKNFRNPAVLFGNAPAEVVNLNDSDPQNAVLEVLAPPNDTEGPVVVRVINNDGQSDTSVYTYLTNLDAPPQVFQVVPPEGGPGTLVSVKGAGFAINGEAGTLATGAKLLVRGAPVQPISATASEVRFVMPTLLTSLASNVELTVENPDEQRASGTFRYRLPAPVLSQVSPAAGTVGTPVTVLGSGLDVLTLTVGTLAVPADQFTTTSSTISFVVPIGLSPSQVQIRVTNRDGQSGSIPFTVVEETPGTTTLLRAVDLAVGDAACPYGGRRLESGVDLNENGQLDANEVDAASVTNLCNLPPTASSPVTIVRSTPIAVGDSLCPNGGTLIQAGLDLNNNGVLEEGEVDPASVTRQCHSPPPSVMVPEASFVFPDVAHAEIPGDVLTVMGQGLGLVTAARVVRFPAPNELIEVAPATL
ncbi:MAG: IPT/TIG domain-containing protein, partial [Myxococcota bacterium]